MKFIVIHIPNLWLDSAYKNILREAAALFQNTVGLLIANEEREMFLSFAWNPLGRLINSRDSYL